MAPRRRPPGTEVTPVDDATLAEVVDAAEQESGAPRELLGTYLASAASCSVRSIRLSEGDLDECRRLGAQAAERGVELRSVLDLYLSATWRLSEHLARSASAQTGAWATSLMRAADDAAAALGEGYELAQRRAIRREESIRRELIDDLLAGVAVGAALQDLAAHVGFNLAGVHQAVVARTDRALRDAGPVQSHVERELLVGRAGDGFVATKEALLVCVLSGGEPSVGDTVLRLVTEAQPGSWTAGVGRPHHGPGGVARSFREAKDALGIAAQLDLPDRVVHIGELLPYRVLMQDRQLLQDAIEDVLGPLASARGGAEPLVATLEAYFDEALSTTAAARRLHLSVRAVTYRLDRVTQLTGRSLRDPRDRFALEVAVRGRRLVGHSTFRDPATNDAPNVRPEP